jgi:hypothetical protein
MSLFNRNRLPKSKFWSAPRGRRARNVARPQIEGLEQRLALSVYTNVIAGQLVITNDASDTITLDHVGSDTVVNGAYVPDDWITQGISIDVNSQPGSLSSIYILANAKPITVHGGNNVSSVNLGNLVDGVQDIDANVDLHDLGRGAYGPLNGIGTAHGFQLNVDDRADTAAKQNITLNLVNGVGSISNLAPDGVTITYDYPNPGSGGLTISGGQGGNVFNVLNTFNGDSSVPGTKTTINTGSGYDAVIVGGAAPEGELDIDSLSDHANVVIGDPGGTLQNIYGHINISNTYNQDNLYLDDGSDTTPRTFQLAQDPSNPNHSTITQLDANGQLDPYAPVIEYGTSQVSYVHISGGSGGNTFNVLDTPAAATTYLATGYGANTVNVLGTTGKLTIIGYGTSDNVNIGNWNTVVQGINGSIYIGNEVGLTNVTLNDFGDKANHYVTVNSANGVGTITGLTPNNSTISYANAQTAYASIIAGSGYNEVDIFGTDTGLSVIGGAGGLGVYVGSEAGTLDTINGFVDVFGAPGADNSLVVDDSQNTGTYAYTYLTSGGSGVMERSGGGSPTVEIDYYTMGDPYFFTPQGLIPPQPEG